MAEQDEIAALKREQDMYSAQGKTERAKEVAAALRAAGVEADEAPKARRSRASQTADAATDETA